jgi:hypothetical protein
MGQFTFLKVCRQVNYISIDSQEGIQMTPPFLEMFVSMSFYIVH